MLIKRSINQLSSSSIWGTVLSTSPLSNSAFTIAINWTTMPDATQNDTIQSHIDSWHYNDTRCLCVHKLEKVNYSFTVNHHNDQHNQRNRRGDKCYRSRPIATVTYSALCFFKIIIVHIIVVSLLYFVSLCWQFEHPYDLFGSLCGYFLICSCFVCDFFLHLYVVFRSLGVCVYHFLVISCPFVSIWCVFLGVLWLVPILLSDH